MCQESPLEALAARICSSAKTISAYCEETNYPHRSFDRDAPSTMLPRTAPQHILVAQQTVLEAAYKIQQLATDASDYLGRQAVQVCSLSSDIACPFPFSQQQFCILPTQYVLFKLKPNTRCNV